ncbi:hypothetical protein F5876DRAFT_45044 [Lentinula aff. lateritia]|uniref:Uncharacterized protein n=1 Tax=Lentinula aff. lateritia TaxID=2804960 RepID=A0ACC1TWE3_9AGAR|nr:hypothetical protein F5876DRAFT_45044 [Lentinula aff. lateritia]
MQTIDNAKDDIAAQLRFESFKLGKPLPASMTLNQQHKHSRSHSRNGSISSAASLPLTTSTNSDDLTVLPTTNSMPVLSSKRNSHHRRRSSVSTRHESADIMGLPDLPASSSEDNIIEKDSVRRRALWALEGKQNDASFSKVEIPELSSPEVEKKMFDFSSKLFSTAPNTGFGKRESFKPSLSKDQLHTLVEEEEEEEDWDFQKSSLRKLPVSTVPLSNDDKLPNTPVTPDDAFAKQTVSRPGAATLTLRPLSLTAGGLHTPSLTPSIRSGLRSLSLVPNDEQPTHTSFNDVSPTPHLRARPVNLQISTSRGSMDETSCALPIRRSSISYKSSAAAGLPTPEMTPTFSERRYSHTSLGSNTSVNGTSNDEDFLQSNASYSHRPLSASEQHFLFKSHNALLSRIQDLEKALIVRHTSVSSIPGSRPLSSSFSVADSEDMSISSEPSDEMLRLVADLKAERDELKRDVDGWRVRVGDLEKQIRLLGKRVEGERREAWVARSRTNLLEAEKNTFAKEYGQAKDEMARMEEEKNNEIAKLTAQIRALEADKQRTVQENAHLLGECEYWKVEAATLSKMRRDEMVISTVRSSHDTEHAPSAWHRGLHYDSVDSLESSTDVDFGSFDSDHGFGFSLKPVAEENEGDLDDVEADYLLEEEDNGLAGYEDEEEEDFTFQSPDSSSSFGSGSNTPATLTPGSRSLSSSPVPSAASNMDALKSTRVQATVVPVHRSVGSLSKTWTFPRAQSTSTSHDPKNDVDKFFDCLEDSETDSTGSRSPVSPSLYTYEHNKGLFAKGLEAFDDNEAMPFALPSNIIGIVVEEQDSPRSLPVVSEEEEIEDDDEQTRVDDDDDIFGDNAGIKITLTPAAEDDNDEYLSPHIEDSDDEETDAEEETDEIAQQDQSDEGNDDDVPFNFELPLRSSTPPHTLAMATPPRSSVRISSPSPSSIPRPTLSFNTPTSSPNILESSPTITLSKLPVRPMSSFVTPPTKRGGAMSSFIPLPITSSSPMRKQPSVREKPLVASFIRQPVRRPLMAANSTISDSDHSFTSPSLSSSQSYSGSFQTDLVGLNDFVPISTLVSTSTATNLVQPISTDEKTLQSSFSSPSLSSIMSSPKLSLQVITGLIPRPWTARTSVSNVDQGDVLQRVDLSTTPAGAKFKSYVSKQKQLERLKLRLQHEGSRTQHSFNDVCQKCDGAVVYL